MTMPLFVVDAFTGRRFRGNPAAVCVLKKPLPEALMKSIAAELNLSETAFVRTLARGRYSLRWFTPQTEVPLCGHATLATAAALFRELKVPGPVLEFETKSGLLTARREGKLIVLDFPAEDYHPGSVSAAVLAALGAKKPKAVLYARLDRNLLLHLASEKEVRGLKPDFTRLKAAKGKAPFLGIIVTAAGSRGYDCVSRYFAPWVGIDEDPVTGSAHCALAPYWAALIHKSDLRAYQASKRGGELLLRLKGRRVELRGQAVVVSAGVLR